LIRDKNDESVYEPPNTPEVNVENSEVMLKKSRSSTINEDGNTDTSPTKNHNILEGSYSFKLDSEKKKK